MLWLACSFLLVPDVSLAELRSGLSATVIEELDSVQLVIRDIGNRQTETPDLSGLEADFHVLGVNTSSQYRFVNGSAQSWVDYQITLQPKAAGELIIAPIRIGQKRTEPLRLSVRRLSPEVRRKIDRLVFYEIELSSDAIYVQSQLLLTRRLVYADGVQLYGGQLETPILENAQVFELGEGQSSVIQRQGQTFGSYEQRYAIFPEQSGLLVLPSVSVTASVQVVNGVTTSRKTVRVSTKEQRITVKPIPQEYPSDKPWLPAIAVTAEQQFEPGLYNTANVGDTIKRRLVTNVLGNTAASIPPTTGLLKEDAFRTYPQPVEIKNDSGGENLIGQRVAMTDIVPIAPGALGLPGISITWWNTDTEEVMVTSIDNRALQVAGAAINNATAPRNENKKDAFDTTPQLGGTVKSNANGLDARITLIAGVFALLVIVIWRRRQDRANTAPDLSATSQKPSNPDFSDVLAAFNHESAAQLRPRLAEYLGYVTGLNQGSAFAAFRRSGKEAAEAVNALNCACYDNGIFTETHRQLAISALNNFEQQSRTKKTKKNPELPPLYPR